LRPGSYTIIVNGGDEYENAFETVSIGHAGTVPGEGNPSQYAIPFVYQVQIYLQPKRANASDVPRAARALFNQALESARAGESSKAIKQFKAAIAQAPKFGLAYNEMGVQYLKLGQADKAAAAFAEAVKLGPDEFLARLNYGVALLNLKKFAEAEQQLRQALSKNAAAATGHYYLALALLNQQKFEAAEAELGSSIRNSNDRIALAHKYLGGIYWHQRQYKRAADELERYLTLDQKAPDATMIRGTIKDLRSMK